MHTWPVYVCPAQVALDVVAVVAVIPSDVVTGWRISLFENIDDFAFDITGFMFHDAAFGISEHGATPRRCHGIIHIPIVCDYSLRREQWWQLPH